MRSACVRTSVSAKSLLGRVIDADGNPIDGGGRTGIATSGMRLTSSARGAGAGSHSRAAELRYSRHRWFPDLWPRATRRHLRRQRRGQKHSDRHDGARHRGRSDGARADWRTRPRGRRISGSAGRRGPARSVVVVSTSDQSPLLRIRAALAATAVAEYFCGQGKNVLLVVDSLTRFAMAQREIGLAAGEPPTAKGYTPSVLSMLARLAERAGRFQRQHHRLLHRADGGRRSAGPASGYGAIAARRPHRAGSRFGGAQPLPADLDSRQPEPLDAGSGFARALGAGLSAAQAAGGVPAFRGPDSHRRLQPGQRSATRSRHRLAAATGRLSPAKAERGLTPDGHAGTIPCAGR